MRLRCGCISDSARHYLDIFELFLFMLAAIVWGNCQRFMSFSKSHCVASLLPVSALGKLSIRTQSEAGRFCSRVAWGGEKDGVSIKKACKILQAFFHKNKSVPRKLTSVYGCRTPSDGLLPCPSLRGCRIDRNGSLPQLHRVPCLLPQPFDTVPSPCHMIRKPRHCRLR